MLHSMTEYARVTQPDRRGATRHDVHIRSVMMDVMIEKDVVAVINISTTGLLAEAKAHYRVGDIVTIDVPNLGQINGVVRWHDKTLIGCEFRDPIDTDSFFHFMALQRAA
jgi:PilZ domain